MELVRVFVLFLACASLALAQTPSPETNPNYNPRAAFSRANPNNWGPYGYPTSLTNPYKFGPSDPDCFCVFDWRGPHGYYDFWVLSDIVFGTYHDPDHWTPFPATEIVPCTTCYVNIYGRGVTFIDKFTFVNTMTVGRDVWDDAFVVVGGRNRGAATTLKIWYDRNPQIFSIEGTRATNGATTLQIVGKSFGFNADNVKVTVTDTRQNVGSWTIKPTDQDTPRLMRGDSSNPESYWQSPGKPSALNYPGNPTTLDGVAVAYECTNLRIYHRDTHLRCDIAIPVVWADDLKVVVSVQFEDNRDTTPTDPLTAERLMLSEYVK